ncbi:UDP-N-acetylmuramoyl-L-alanine--D-glutamate ligase [Cesiribacter andamanensis]|uniref:UDP-N-acetylmuramoylalanine--D-glutamate ligase n=1 Tax=Cesiribacter andamanensis AMV16 TaxID=1279009 RepID=M7N8F2_9BACT|nr:UDP-N-acetylmuramoyl-L-alanine--D-glutamate ligase [Cesiribacter andamanensis]EMR03542.1 UDP-N-acetylmuramoylalanine--D-glutamate ligase [Cesiribacter andamanensis AMV16]
MGKREQVVVLGGGESGTGAALLAARMGWAVFLSDKGKLGDAYRQQLVEKGIPFEEEGHHSEDLILQAALVIKSPGIPDTAPLVQQLRQRGVPVIDELSFALRHTAAKVLAITGTNGKTTTTLLLYHLLKEGGLNVGLGGNVGRSLAAQLAEGEQFDWLVLEVSSYQLDGMPGFAPHTGILTNITPDHLDRYDYKFENYIASKMQLVQHMGQEEAFIYYAEDPVIRQALEGRGVKAQLLPVAAAGRPEAAAMLEAEWIRIKGPVRDTLFLYADMVLQGKHNYINTACAVLAAYRAGVSEQAISRGLRSFQNAPHRLEPIAEIKGVAWINDSKATNVDSAWYALDAMQRPIVWIAGGTDKGNDYSQLLPLVQERVKALVCLGVDTSKLQQAFEGVVPMLFQTGSMEEAVQAAAAAAQAGDVVLLSPACASFDLFRNYIDRGDQFRRQVMGLYNEQ